MLREVHVTTSQVRGAVLLHTCTCHACDWVTTNASSTLVSVCRRFIEPSAFGTLFVGVRGVSLYVWCRKLEVDASVMYAQDAEPA